MLPLLIPLEDFSSSGTSVQQENPAIGALAIWPACQESLREIHVEPDLSAFLVLVGALLEALDVGNGSTAIGFSVLQISEDLNPNPQWRPNFAGSFQLAAVNLGIAAISAGIYLATRTGLLLVLAILNFIYGMFMLASSIRRRRRNSEPPPPLGIEAQSGRH